MLTVVDFPVFMPNTEIVSGPLLYDIDGDGLLDLLAVTKSGELRFVK